MAHRVAASRHLLLLSALFLAATALSDQEGSSPDSNVLSGLKLAYKTYQQCEEQADMMSCLKFRAVRFVDRALRKESIPLVDGWVTLARTEEGARTLAEPQEEEVEKSLPQEPEAKQQKLDEMLMDRVERFFQTHTMQLAFPSFSSSDDAEDDGVSSGRGKSEKYLPVLMAMMMKGGLAAMAYKAVALLAGKALLVAKVALVVTGILALSKLTHGGGEEGRTTYEIIKAPMIAHEITAATGHVDMGAGGGVGGGGMAHGWGRSLDAHAMAFGGQVGRGQVEEVPL